MLKEAAVNEHPSDETIAAFTDGRLEGAGREAVVGHLAFCDDCRALWDSVSEEVSLEPAQPANVVPGRFGKRWAAVGASVAAAAVAAMSYLYLYPAVIEPSRNLAELKAAVVEMDERPTLARLNGFPYREKRNPRGSNDGTSISLEIAEADALNAAEHHPTAKNLHVAGVAKVLTHKRDRKTNTDDFADAIKALEEASAKRPNDAAILNDLSAAYLTNCVYGAQADCERAFNAASKAWNMAHTPESGWNMAAAATRDALAKADERGNQPKGLIMRAENAWNEYLKIEPDPHWIKEARRERKYLRSDG